MSLMKVLQAHFQFASNSNICAALRSIRPVLKSPIAQIIISFVVGYYATTKIVQVYILYRTHAGSDSQEKMSLATTQAIDSQNSLPLSEAQLPAVPEMLRLTRLQLMAYDGMRAGEPIYTALNGNIYDLSSSRDTFLRPGPYSLLAGCNANQVLNIACGSMGVSTADVIQRWERSLNAEFNIIGQLIDSDDSDSDELL